VEAVELDDMAATISFTRQVQTKLNFKLLHSLGPQNTEQVETKVLLTMFNRKLVQLFIIHHYSS